MMCPTVYNMILGHSKSIYLPYLHEHYSLTLTLCSFSTWMSSKERSPAKEVQFLLLICHYEPQVQRSAQFPQHSQSLLWWNQSFTNQHIRLDVEPQTCLHANRLFKSCRKETSFNNFLLQVCSAVMPAVTCSSVQTTVNRQQRRA